MAVSALSLMIFLALIGYSNAVYCLCNPALNNSVLQKNIDSACKNGADCARIYPKGACFSPNTVKDHCNYAVNSYYQRKNEAPGSCDFSGTAAVTQQAPPGSKSACYPGKPS
ncbi:PLASMODESMATA CALLOSE-BINDING PROTEIN 4-like [Bidens hawaiensis]|uniref:PLASMODESMATA CALLOSE-BINDING PROTEIN 4-like n=1 Tax=Bidens hawaiensis TaxID=980011 RepID=UPI00404B2E09